MESVIPPVLQAVRSVQWFMQSGLSMNESLRSYMEMHNDSFAAQIREAHMALIKGRPREVFLESHRQQAFWNLIVRANKGEPVLEALRHLEEEIEHAAQSELEEHIALLPFKMMLPLLLLMFPAYLIVLIGPLLRELNKGLGG